PTFSEKDMSLARAHLVRGTTLAEIAAELDLGACLRMGSGELKSGGRQRRSILADALEAVLGAVHEDGGIGACEQLIERLLAERIATLDIRSLKDAKTRLQEYLQGAQRSLPVYEVVDTYGADHAREYRIACVLDDGTRVEARSSSRRKAEKDAARLMLAELGVEQ
ncbi:MAG: putative dsRNA-binding protein, partial [Pseudomonadales bacterium]